MQQTFVLPYLRSSPIHLPRRDLVVGGADSVLLVVSIVESDTPCAPALVLTGGIGGPALRMTVWPDSGGWYRDYGMWWPTVGSVLWSGTGTISDSAAGTFELRLPIGTMMTWPLRCSYALQLDWDGATLSETLAQGALHVRRFTVAPSFDPPPLLTDDRVPVHDDTDEQVLA